MRLGVLRNFGFALVYEVIGAPFVNSFRIRHSSMGDAQSPIHAKFRIRHSSMDPARTPPNALNYFFSPISIKRSSR
jgi:hypothetical protein